MLRERLIGALGTDGVKTEPEDLSVYAFDAYTEGGRPSAVVLPRSTNEVSAVVKIAREFGEPIVARGAGTGLCGGAVPAAGGVVVSTMRMNRILELDVANRRARVEPGRDESRPFAARRRRGALLRSRSLVAAISTIGGNVATNAGGPHCLSYGTTVNHVLAARGRRRRPARSSPRARRAGLRSHRCAGRQRGHLGIVSPRGCSCSHCPKPYASWVAAFDDIEAASEAVSAIVAAGIVPTALEMMDASIVRAVEAAFQAGYPTDAAAVLLSRTPDSKTTWTRANPRLRRSPRSTARYLAQRHAPAERDALLGRAKGRRRCDRADRAKLLHARRLRAAQQTPGRRCAPSRSRRAPRRSTVGNVFHAGDGNLHPLLMYDRRDRKQVAAVVETGNASCSRRSISAARSAASTASAMRSATR